MTITTDDALAWLAAETAKAAVAVLSDRVQDDVRVMSSQVFAAGAPPLGDLPVPGVATSVGFGDGATGGNLFHLTIGAARRLAAATLGTDAPEGDELADLTAAELEAVSAVMVEVMSAGATAIGAVLGKDLVVESPETSVLTVADAVLEPFGTIAHATSTTVELLGEPCRLIQLVPNAFLVRTATALDELDEYARGAGPEGDAASDLAGSLLNTPVRVWAELGRAQMAAGRVVALPPGAVVELDRLAAEPVDVYVNGMPFARGRLVVADGGDWAVRIERIHGRIAADAA